MDNIIELPDYAELKKEVGELREKLSKLIYEHDDLKYTICENIKNKYILEIGSLEYKAYELYCDYLRLRRKKDLIQAKVNRKEKANLKEIEKQLDSEFLEYKDILDYRLSQINDAIEYSEKPILTPDQVYEFKKIYRRLIKDLHPDLHPDLSDEERELFYRVIDVYKNGDFYMMNILNEIVNEKKEIDPINDSLLNLKNEKERLTSLIEKISFEINNIKETEPYIWKKYLEDEEEKNKKIKEIKNQIDSFLEAIKTQEEYIKSIMEIKYE